MNFGSRAISMFNRVAPKISRGIGQAADIERNIGQVVKHSVMYCKTSIPHNTHIFYQTRNRIDHCQTFSDIRVFHEKYIFDRETGQILIPRYFLFDCFYLLMTAYVCIQNVLIFGSIRLLFDLTNTIWRAVPSLRDNFFFLKTSM